MSSYTPADARDDAGSEHALALARATFARGDAADAAARCRAQLERDGSDPRWWNLLGETLRVAAPAEAEAAWRRALALDPRDAEAHFHLGNLLRERRDHAGAVAEFRKALDAMPGHVGTLNNLGLTLADMGEGVEAEQYYRAALAANPQQPDALGNLASILFEREAFADAVECYARMFAIRREAPAAVWVRRAIAQQKAGALADAESSFREAARLLPDDPRVYMNLGTVLIEQRRYADADAPLQRALELSPDAGTLSLVAHARQACCAWDGLETMFVELERMLDGDACGNNANPFNILAVPLSPLTQLNTARRWSAQMAPSEPAPRPARRQMAGERLRIGFVSSDFRDHPVGRLTADLFERLDRRQVEVFAYALQPADQSTTGRRIRNAIEHFAEASAVPTPELAERIRRDRITVLFDLNGYTTHERARLFARRPAPLAINWLGYPGTLGADWYDYILTDAFSTPPDFQRWFSERFLYLEGCALPTDSRRDIAAEAPSRRDCGLPSDGFVFCAFNNQYKILPSIFDVWMRLLAQVDGSVLWLSAAPPESAANLHREAARRGIDPARLIFAPPVTHPEHLARHAHADLFVDTHPYNAGSTANEALWMGLPIVTYSGTTMVSRMAGSQLKAAGLSDLATGTLDDYEALALRLARRREELAQVRARLHANRRTHRFFDMAAFAQDFVQCVQRAAAFDDGGSPGIQR